MKKIMNLYESCKTPIRVTYIGFLLVAVGYFIQSPSVNVFYTFRSNTVLFLAELFLKLGEIIIMNIPLIFMVNIVCKKANNASPIIMALVGYFTFVVTTMLFGNQSLGSLAYSNGYGINSVFNISSGTRLPLETGLIGSFLVAYVTRAAFIFSRHRGPLSIANIFSKDTAGLVYNFAFCFVLGAIVSYAYPYFFNFIQRVITFIGQDLSDPLRIGVYSVADRVLSMLGLGNIIRYPFWYTSTGGSFSNTLTGQSIAGDVNIWKYIQDSNATYLGAGRFITPYYVINMFMIPGIYIGTLLSMSDKSDRRYLSLEFIAGIILSIVAGNPLPLEYLMLFTSPVLLLMYLIGVGIVSGGLVNFGAYLGFNNISTNTAIAMPGSFADYIINIRNINLVPSLRMIALIGLAALVACILMTMFYYRFLAYDFVKTGSGDEFVDKLIDAVGGIENISFAGSGLFKLNVSIKDHEKMSIEKLQDTGVKRVYETRNGLSFEIGTSCATVSRMIRKRMKELNKKA